MKIAVRKLRFFRLWLIYNRGTSTMRTVPPLTLSKCWLIWVGTWDSCWVTLPTALQTSLTTCGNSGNRRRQSHMKIVQLTLQIPNKRTRNLNKTTKNRKYKKWESIVFCLIYQNFSTHWSLSRKKPTQFFLTWKESNPTTNLIISYTSIREIIKK